MRSRLCGAALAAVAATLFVAGAAVSAPRAKAPAPPVAFTGRYAVTFKITNAKNFTPTHWVYGVMKPCSSPCRSVSFHQRLTSEKTWRSFILTYTWNGAGYAVAPRVQRGISDCRGAGGATVRKGYDVTSTQTLRVTTATNGRVVRFIGTGKDAYLLNAAGRKGGCAVGTYVFAITGATL